MTHERPKGARSVSVSVRFTTWAGLSATFCPGNTVPSGNTGRGVVSCVKQRIGTLLSVGDGHEALKGGHARKLCNLQRPFQSRLTALWDPRARFCQESFECYASGM